MDLRLSDEQEQLVESVAALYEKHASSDRVRSAEPTGHDPGLWAQIVKVGLVEMAVEEAAGGWGASAQDLTLVAEQHGRAIAPAPVIETQVAARLLARLEAGALETALSGDRLVTLALHPAVGARATAIPAGSIADDAVIVQADQILLVRLDGSRRPFSNVASMPLADIDLGAEATEVLATGNDARVAFEAAIDDWLRLTAAALVGIGAHSLELCTEYVLDRKAWGQPIGAFQSVAHGLADVATALDGARLLAYEAAWAVDKGVPRASELAALAFAFASDAARDVTDRCLHYHGGYGFMLEYDAQMYWRRARGWAGVWGDASRAYRRAADRRYGGCG